jgi:hypothetical protein
MAARYGGRFVKHLLVFVGVLLMLGHIHSEAAEVLPLQRCNVDTVLLPSVGETWLALYQEKDNFVLKPFLLTSVSTRRSDGKSQEKIKFDWVGGDPNPEFLFKGVSGLKPKEWVFGYRKILHYEPQNSDLVFPGQVAQFHGRESDDGINSYLYAVGRSGQDHRNPCFQDYSILVSDLRKEPTPLFKSSRVCGDRRLTLEWAGWLEDDMVADYLLRVPRGDHEWAYVLYLSGTGVTIGNRTLDCRGP